MKNQLRRLKWRKRKWKDNLQQLRKQKCTKAKKAILTTWLLKMKKKRERKTRRGKRKGMKERKTRRSKRKGMEERKRTRKKKRKARFCRKRIRREFNIKGKGWMKP